METRNSPGLQSIAGLLGMPEETWPETDLSGNKGRQVGEAEARRQLLPTPTAQMPGNTPENHLSRKPGRTQVTALDILIENDLLSSGGRIDPPSNSGST